MAKPMIRSIGKEKELKERWITMDKMISGRLDLDQAEGNNRWLRHKEWWTLDKLEQTMENLEQSLEQDKDNKTEEGELELTQEQLTALLAEDVKIQEITVSTSTANK